MLNLFNSLFHYISIVAHNKVKACLRSELKPLPDMPILGSSNSAANKDMMSRIWTNWDAII